MLFDIPKEDKSIIKVIGVGGGGSNAVNHMFEEGIVGVDFAICNTDIQSMDISNVPVKIALGPHLTDGLGAGSKPDIGKQACIESIDDVRKFLEENTKMLFVTAGMGGGTGTGAAPIIAKAAREMDILTVGIVTLPFIFEGKARSRQALQGLDEMKKNVDSLIVISNDKLGDFYGNLSVSEAFAQADNVLLAAAKSIAEIITKAGKINVDFEDVNTVMRDSGVSIMGTAAFGGEDRARKAVDGALNSPLLEDNDIRGAKHILLNISYGSKEITMNEAMQINEYVQEEAGHSTNLIWGHCMDETLGDKISVTVIATGFEIGKKEAEEKKRNQKIRVPLEEDRMEADKNVFDLDILGTTESANTVVFEDLPKPRTHNTIDNEPFISSSDPTSIQEDTTAAPIMEQEKEKKLPPVQPILPMEQGRSLHDLENEPAYLRQQVELDDVPHSSKQEASRWSIQDDGDDINIIGENSFLHDQVD